MRYLPFSVCACRRNVKVPPGGWQYQKKFKLVRLPLMVGWQGRTTCCPTLTSTSEKNSFRTSPPMRPATQAEMCLQRSLLPSLTCSYLFETAPIFAVFPKKWKVQISTSIPLLHFSPTSSSCLQTPPNNLLKTMRDNRKDMNTPT